MVSPPLLGGGSYHKVFELNTVIDVLRAFYDGVAYDLWSDQIGHSCIDKYEMSSHEFVLVYNARLSAITNSSIDIESIAGYGFLQDIYTVITNGHESSKTIFKFTIEGGMLKCQ